MGAWGYRNFENDYAADYVGDFQDLPGEALLLSALATVLEEEAVIESDVAGEALAAAEIIAAALGKPGPDLPADVQAAVTQLDLGEDSELQEMAQEAVEVILAKSALRDSWEESGKLAGWQAVQHDLLARLA
jgi:hypothetical protein